ALAALAGAGRRATALGALGLVAAVATPMVVPADVFRAGFEQRFGKLLYFKEEVTDTVMVSEDVRGDRMIRYGDGRGTAGTMTVSDDRMYAHLPMLLHPAPTRILSICFGVGNSLAALVRHPIEWVEAVELSPGVVGAAPLFARTNRDVLADPRVRLTITDGRNFLLTSHETYDVIRLDPPELHTAGVVNLYTREFYELARDHLRPGGIFSIWVNIVMTPEADLRLLVRTLASVFPYANVWQGPLRYSWVINGSMTPIDPDLRLLLRHYDEAAAGADLRENGLPDPYSLLALWGFGGRELAGFAGRGPGGVGGPTRPGFPAPPPPPPLFGFSNANSANWLTDFMAPNAHENVAARVFFTKIATMGRFRTPVLDHLRGIEAGGTPDEVAARIAQAGGVVPGRSGQPAGL